MYIRQNSAKTRLGSFERLPTSRKNRRISGFSGAEECARLQSEIATKQQQAVAWISSNPGMHAQLMAQASQLQAKIPEVCKDVGKPSAAPSASAGEVLTGVGSILSALATPAAGIFQTYTEAKLAKSALKRDQQVPMYTGPMQPQFIQQGPSTGLILGLVGGFAAIALILVLVLKK